MKLAKIFKIFALVIASLLLLLSIGITLFITFYPAENIRNMVTAQAESTLGRKVTVGGIGYGFGGVSLDRVVLHETDETSPVLVSVDRADLRFSLLSLLQRELNFSTISLKNARCNIVFDDKNESNIQKLINGLSKAGDSGISTKISRIVLNDTVITLTNPPPYLAPLAGAYRVDGTIVIKKDILVKDCSIQLPESRGKVHPELVIRTMKDDFEITGKARLENAALPWVYRWGDNVTLPYNVVNGMVTNLVITKNFVKGDAVATSTLLNSSRIIRADGFCNVSIKDRTVFIGKTQGGIEKSSFYIDGLLFTFDGKLLRFDIKNIAAQIADVVPILKFIPARLYGRVEGDLKYEGGLYNGALSLINCGYDPGSKIVTGLHAKISVANNMFKKTGIPFNFYGNPCALSIASVDTSLSRLFINIGAEKIVIKPGTVSAFSF